MPVVFSELLGERQYVSQYSVTTIGMVIHKAGVPGNADGDVTVAMKTLDDVTTIFTRTADNPAAGTYEVTISSVESSTPGIFQVIWTYQVDSIDQEFIGLVEVGASSPAYDGLADGFKGVVESVWMRFADLFDSQYGGPNLQVYFQSRWTRGRIAQLVPIAVGKLNSIAQPQTTYAVDDKFPFAQWGALLEQSVYIEALKHLIRSYTEQPETQNVGVARQDRRDYQQRWMTVLAQEVEDQKNLLDVFKIAHMGLGRPAVLVSGGVYGVYGPTRLPGSAAARPRYWYRFFA